MEYSVFHKQDSKQIPYFLCDMAILQFQTMKALAVNFYGYCSHDFLIAEHEWNYCTLIVDRFIHRISRNHSRMFSTNFKHASANWQNSSYRIENRRLTLTKNQTKITLNTLGCIFLTWWESISLKIETKISFLL